ncbi:transcriptional regulator [Aureimonas sp. SK2]|uniref:transcriptional regulator n=1 Tax=Aureimonas sp. SK2 TaxID=3015992 RepID=UPI0024449D41|nr:transcriptional regulator [Aureimonas sp. SK2]
MTRAAKTPVDFVSKAESAWSPAPAWVLSLAQACNERGQTAVAKDVRYSASTISQVLSNTYAGVHANIEARVRGALMAETVVCPMQGTMSRNTCLDWQAKPFAPTSGDRVRMYHACRSGCPHSKITKETDHG